MEEHDITDDEASAEARQNSGAQTNDEPKIENYSIEELERTLDRLIREENYEEAAKVSEILKRKRGND
ncbi:UvrB/UvrC motif-containing protein, partial [uncultured Muribaculum sp.]